MSAQTCTVTIGGVTKSVEQLRASLVLNGVGEASFDTIATGAAYVPSDGDAVVITLGGSTWWSGEIVEATCTFLGPTAGSRASVVAHDKNALLARALSNGIIPAGTLEDAIDSVTGVGGVWNDVGITKDAAQATGPSLDVITAAWMDGAALAKYLSDLSGYVFRVDATGAIKFWSPGSVSSGVTFSTANGNFDDITWQRDRWDYRNRVWVIYGPSEVRTVSDPFVGDGATRSFSLHYQVAAAPGTVSINNGVTTVVQPVGVYGVDAMEWTFDAATGSYGAIRQDAAYTVLSGSDLLTVEYASQFPNYVFVDDSGEVASRGQWNTAVTLPDVTELDEATAYGAAYIRRSIPRPKVATLRTRVDGITPGSTVVVSLSEIGISETMLVQRVDVVLEKANNQVYPVYTLSLVSGSELADTSAQLFQRIVDGGAPSSVASGGSLATTSVTTVVAMVVEGDLGGSRLSGVTHSTWTPTREHREWRCPEDGAYTAYVEVWTSNAATSVTPRIYDVTAAAAVATGSASSSTTAAKQTLGFTGTAGHEYRLDLLPGNSSNDVFGLGKVRT